MPASSAWRVCGQLVRSHRAVCAMSSPSAPAAALAALTRFSAAYRFALVSAASSRAPAPPSALPTLCPGADGAGRWLRLAGQFACGFTARYPRPLGLPRHPTHGLGHPHVFGHSRSVGSSSSWSCHTGPRLGPLRPLLTARRGMGRRPFRHKARSPRVTAPAFAAQPPHRRRLALITRTAQFMTRSSCSAGPSIWCSFIGSQLRSALPPHTQSPSCSCASLRSL
jgi:hypothetical protein